MKEGNEYNMAYGNKAASVDLRKLNEGYPQRALYEGDWVKVYKIPYRQARLEYEGELVKIHRVGEFCVVGEVLPKGEENTRIAYLYTGKVYDPYKS